MQSLRILHITGVRRLTPGQRKQLLSEYNIANNLNKVQWDVVALHTENTVYNFEKRIPKFFRPLFLRNLYIWVEVLKYKNSYDVILMRHIAFDPFVLLFAPLLKNRVTVHHAKEVYELRLIRSGWVGKAASNLERFTGRVSAKNVYAIAGVTKEISEYQNILHNLQIPTIFYPNGIDLNKTTLLQDQRKDDEINIVFICGKFSSWHGLDLIFDSTNKKIITDNIKIHLIGSLSIKQIESVEHNLNRNAYIMHGVLETSEYVKILSVCDVSLGSLALFRKKLREASTLKVREMLAMGIPIYSCHIDPSLSELTQYYYYSESFDFDELINFSLNMKKISRQTIRDASAEYISKENVMKNLTKELNTLICNKCLTNY